MSENGTILSGDRIVPVFLGYTRESGELARRIWRKYRVLSHVFCEPVPASRRLSLWLYTKFHTVPRTEGDRLMLRELTDFSAQLEGMDVLPYLIPCTEAYAGMIWNHSGELESRFLIAEPWEIEQAYLAETELGEEIEDE